MAQVHRLQPHDPIPETRPSVLVLRRLGEDSPDIAVTEIIVTEGADPSALTVAIRPDGTSMQFDEAIGAGVAEADRRGISAVYAVDRTAGPRERDVLEHEGDHTRNMDRLEDSDAGESGSDLRDRPMDAGYNLTPHR